MIQEIAPHVFHNEYLPRKMRMSDFIVCYDKNQLILNLAGNDPQFPVLGQYNEKLQPSIASASYYLFSIDERGFFLVDRTAFRKDELLLPGFAWKPMQLFRQISTGDLPHAINVSYHIYTWLTQSRYCGCCGAKTLPDTRERAMVCPACKNIIYPRISPAVAVAVIDKKKDRILLAKGLGEFRKFALIAGFVEIGETVEECVHREVMEEVGVSTGALHYFKSQPWGLSGIEMLGFFAELEGSDEITIQETEIAEARWFHREELEEGPLQSLSFTLMDAFRQGKHLEHM